MGKSFRGKIALGVLGGLLFASGWLLGQQTAPMQKTLLHVFAFTPLEGATQQDFDNFKKATADMVGKIQGFRRVWFAKLQQPLPADPNPRLYGVAMEFDDLNALKVYADHPVHKDWEKVYEKVRVRGTTTMDILGE